ncbi:MAG: nucleotidyltransferase substrate binding protein [Pseudomonadota bacterium]|nr:nucleotidyltransferase substrate binding protein [Pseudomonadota bacterium]
MILLEPLRQALDSLDEAAREPLQGRLAKNIRDSVIQRFEYTYELAWKTLKRALMVSFGYDEDTVRDIYRRGFEVGLLQDVERWLAFHTARNMTSHTYNEKIADQTYAVAQEFLKEARLLLQRLEALDARPA